MLCVVFGTTVLPSSICFWKIFGEIVLSVLFQNSWLLAVSTKSPNLTNDCMMKIPWFIWGWRLLKLSFVWSQQTLHRTPTTAPCTFTSISQGYAFFLSLMYFVFHFASFDVLSFFSSSSGGHRSFQLSYVSTNSFNVGIWTEGKQKWKAMCPLHFC